MPRLSVIVPVYRVQAYLRQCLDSVLEQSWTDFEVVAVDDASPDGCGAILDEYAARDSRVRVLHLSENVGLGRARNAGIEASRGDYIIFLDSDDTLTPGSLEAMADRLAQTSDPDILIYDYARTFWSGRVVRNMFSHLLQVPGPDVFSVADHPQLLDLLMIVCNKAYRRSFVEHYELSFPTGFYEDTPFTYSAMLSAQRIAILDRVCLHYRQRRTGGNILRTRSRKHFDIFGQYRRVFDYVDRHPELASWRESLFVRMIDHLITVLEKPDRLPADARAEFFHEAARLCRELDPASAYQLPEGLRGRKQRCIRDDDYSAFRRLEVAVRARSAGRRRKSDIVQRATKSRSRLRRSVLKAYYRLQRMRPVDERLAAFAAYWYRGFSCNPRAIYEELRRVRPDVRAVWVLDPEVGRSLPSDVEWVKPGTWGYYRLMAQARWLVNNANFPGEIVKRRGTVHVQTHHGTPLKYMGVDVKDYPAVSVGNFDKLLARADRWDYVVSSNRFSSEIWERAYPCDFEILEYGYPRNDRYYTADAAEVVRLRAELGIDDDRTVVLYAPTHRDYRRDFVPMLDLEKVCDELGPDYVVLVRAHYFYDASEQLAALQAAGRLIDVSSHPTVEDLALAADVLVTDYSSIMFDYANLDRPIVLYTPDWEIYRETRGVYFDIYQTPPGSIVTTSEQFVDVLRSRSFESEQARAARAEFRRRFCDFDDGQAAARTVRRVVLDEPVPPVVPLDERTPAPTPRAALAALGRPVRPAAGEAGADEVANAS